MPHMQMSSDDLMLATCLEPGFHIPEGSLHGFGLLLENPGMDSRGAPRDICQSSSKKTREP
jgi:hypothetical protein